MLASPVTQDYAHADASSSNHRKRTRQRTRPTLSQREGHYMFESEGFTQTVVFLEASQQSLEVEWPSYIQPSIPHAHIPCDDGVQHNVTLLMAASLGLHGLSKIRSQAPYSFTLKLFNDYQQKIKLELTYVEFELREYINQYDGFVYYGVINIVSDEQSKLGIKYIVP
ncbi:non-structural maintenance of chromosomes element 1 [Tanacetum coccineum]